MSSDHLENYSAPASARPAATRLLNLLKSRGPQTAGDLGTALEITGEAARQQLEKLATEGLVRATPQACGVGRPSKLWSITPQGNARFPDMHAALTVDLISAMQRAFGAAGLQRLLALRTKQQIAAYRERIGGNSSLHRRLQTLAEIRTQEGYMAEVLEQENGIYLLVENHCPICVAATACLGLCGAELEVFQQVLGPEAQIERTEHIVSGARRCAYRIHLRARKGPRDRRSR
jgi:predicted ArsR family transcriptional regulator